MYSYADNDIKKKKNNLCVLSKNVKSEFPDCFGFVRERHTKELHVLLIDKNKHLVFPYLSNEFDHSVVWSRFVQP